MVRGNFYFLIVIRACFVGVEDTYSRIDYICLSHGMPREWVTNETYVLTATNWGVASDHRPLVATFEARDK